MTEERYKHILYLFNNNIREFDMLSDVDKASFFDMLYRKGC